MVAASACPPAPRLQTLLDGRPAAPETGELTAHLEECPACRDTLERLAGGGGWAAAGRRLGAVAGPPEPALRKVMVALRRAPAYVAAAPARVAVPDTAVV